MPEFISKPFNYIPIKEINFSDQEWKEGMNAMFDDKSKNKKIKLIDEKLFKAYSKAHSKFIRLSDKLQKVLWSMGDDKKLYL